MGGAILAVGAAIVLAAVLGFGIPGLGGYSAMILGASLGIIGLIFLTLGDDSEPKP